jgi:hypothetical protein
MKWFRKKHSILEDTPNNQTYIIHANKKYNGIVLEYNEIDIIVGETIHNKCKVGDRLVSINNIDVDHNNLEKILYKFKNKNKELKFLCIL